MVDSTVPSGSPDDTLRNRRFSENYQDFLKRTRGPRSTNPFDGPEGEAPTVAPVAPAEQAPVAEEVQDVVEPAVEETVVEVEETVEAEQPVTPEPEKPVIQERVIEREIHVVDRRTAQDLGYSGSTTTDDRHEELADRHQQIQDEVDKDKQDNRGSSLLSRLFQGETTVSSGKQTVEGVVDRGVSRFKDEGNVSEYTTAPAPAKTGRKRKQAIVESDANDTIDVRTASGVDAREARLKLQHEMVSHDREDVDPQKWLETTMKDALDLGASDLHITVEGESRNLIVRIRVDGQMRDYDYIVGTPAKVIRGRFLTQTGLPTGGDAAPRDAIYELMLDGESRKTRVVMFKTHDGGEGIVMRLPLVGALRTLDELAFSDQNLELVKELVAQPYKLIMMAGPMGSGKTTTAHGMLLQAARPTRTVWTIEEPVERTLPNTIQLEVDPDSGVGFDVLLSKLLRADYNTLFLGEIRDEATAAAAVKQAKAGRQVMSTIHADDNIKSLMRLIELAGDSPMSVLSAVGGVISQRLVRKLNPDWDGVDPDTKYKSRTPIHEILFVNDNIVEVMMNDKSTLTDIKRAVSDAKGSLFKDDVRRLIEAGITDREEVLSVIGEYED